MITYLSTALIFFLFFLIVTIGLDYRPPEMSDRAAFFVSLWAGIIWPVTVLMFCVAAYFSVEKIFRKKKYNE